MQSLYEFILIYIEESLDFAEKSASEKLGAVRLRKVQQKINRRKQADRMKTLGLRPKPILATK